jgi:signal peptidase I
MVGIAAASAVVGGFVGWQIGHDDSSAVTTTPLLPTTPPPTSTSQPGRTFVMDGTSMYSTLQDGDEILVVPPSDPIAGGEIVVIEQSSGGDRRTLVSRVIAVGGETIEMLSCYVMIDGTEIEEPYLDPEVVTPGNCGGDLVAMTVPEGHVFVMGDNRGGSQDSRALGPIPLDDLVGIVVSVRDPGGNWVPVAAN